MGMIEKMTDRSLREIEVFAATQGSRVIFEEIDQSLQGIAPDDDPLGLKVLLTGANNRYWNWLQMEQFMKNLLRKPSGLLCRSGSALIPMNLVHNL